MYITCHQLQIDYELYEFIVQKVLPGTGISINDFWKGFSDIVQEFSVRNESLLEERNHFQSLLNDWHKSNPGPIQNIEDYIDFLKDIGYLLPVPEFVEITTGNVDTEITTPGPQLVVPLLNARYALNAVNARWGSLYDALYGTDAIDNKPLLAKNYDKIRGTKVVSFVKNLLDDWIPLAKASHKNVTLYKILNGKLICNLEFGTTTYLVDEHQLVGYTGDFLQPTSVVFVHHGIHIMLQICKEQKIGSYDKAGVCDVIIESALSTILDLEDSVSAVSTKDKIVGYENWLGIMEGNLQTSFKKNGETITRELEADIVLQSPIGKSVSIPGRALLFLRIVGHHMKSSAMLTLDDEKIYEGIMDTIITITIALQDLFKSTKSEFKNTRKGSIYIVKPKMHGPKEVAFTVDLFSAVESFLHIPPNTVKLGIMDEERRTSVNLKACIHEAKDRLVFINTGFLDRTGDEIHSCMYAGPVFPKSQVKTNSWLSAYELRNVLIGLECGLQKQGQIGKGMWAMPKCMHNMLVQKIEHPLAGASTAWVPSPSAATLHALHYHSVDVKKIQEQKIKINPKDFLGDLLTIPVVLQPNWTLEQIKFELENNCQGILGYVVRWIEQGIGCSTVNNMNNVGLMEDRATLRISSQHVANWILHGIVSLEQVNHSLEKMARFVDDQNLWDTNYVPMSNNLENSLAFLAAKELIFTGLEQPNGYTEEILHKWRFKKLALE
jgi:malate synthase